ncbi:MAG: ACT domain-containing protein [Spirochaetales bacterium]|nr:MAG: ACT domain-containing protein [Spirochaetales bacterium]
MLAHQLTIPAENKPGMLARVTAILAKEKINLRAISISSFGDHGFFNMIVDEPKRAHKALSKEGLSVALKEVVAVLIDDHPGGLDGLVQVLAAEKINVENAYGFVLETHKNAVFVVEVDDREKTQKILSAKGYKTLDADALNAIEPFHYMKY